MLWPCSTGTPTARRPSMAPPTPCRWSTWCPRTGGWRGLMCGLCWGEPWIGAPPAARQVEPASLKALKEESSRRWCVIGLLDLIKETGHVTQFTSQFTSVASRTVTDPEVIRRRLLLCLYGLGTNVGIKRVADGVAAS